MIGICACHHLLLMFQHFRHLDQMLTKGAFANLGVLLLVCHEEALLIFVFNSVLQMGGFV